MDFFSVSMVVIIIHHSPFCAVVTDHYRMAICQEKKFFFLTVLEAGKSKMETLVSGLWWDLPAIPLHGRLLKGRMGVILCLNVIEEQKRESISTKPFYDDILFYS